MRITVSGTPGSGKSTVADLVAKKLKMKRYSVGDMRGQMAMSRGMTIDELNELGEEDFSTDKVADEWQKELGLNEDNFVIDGRLSFHFIPNSVKVFLECDMDVGAQRILLDPRDDEKSYDTVEELQAALKTRMESDVKRYRQYYQLNPFKREHYDILIDTTSLKPEEVADKVILAMDRMKGRNR